MTRVQEERLVAIRRDLDHGKEGGNGEPGRYR